MSDARAASGASRRPRHSTQERPRKDEGPGPITEREPRGSEYLNMEVQASIRIRRDGGGKFPCGLGSGQSDGEVVQTVKGGRFECTWEGNDEGDEASGSGGLEMVSQNNLEGRLKSPRGDSSTLAAERAPKRKTRK